MEEKYYPKKFYEHRENATLRSANEIIPIVLKLIQPKSVADVGCGTGIWLSVFQEYGITDILGIDGDWVDDDLLLIPKERFLQLDLKNQIQIGQKFDLVVSLEVAEHIPKECAEMFVDSLTKLGPVILFSAAIPFQGGDHHINCQWPEYWVKYFHERGYLVIDCIRKMIWKNNNISFWYAQNILLFVRNDYLKTNDLLQEEYKNTNMSQLSIVHPKMYLGVNDQLRGTIRILPTRNWIGILPKPIQQVGKKLIKSVKK